MGALLSLVHIGIISLTLQPNSILHIAYHDYILKKGNPFGPAVLLLGI